MNKNTTIGILILIVIAILAYLAFRPHPATVSVTTTATIPTTGASVSGTTAPTPISVDGMTKYTDASLGFSFWYPSNWTVIPSPQNLPFGARLQSATVVKKLALQAPGESSPDILIQEARSTTRTITDTGGAGPIGPVTYYFDTTTHLWMMTASPDEGGQTTAANISNNTMGGLHEFAGT